MGSLIDNHVKPLLAGAEDQVPTPSHEDRALADVTRCADRSSVRAIVGVSQQPSRPTPSLTTTRRGKTDAGDDARRRSKSCPFTQLSHIGLYSMI